MRRLLLCCVVAFTWNVVCFASTSELLRLSLQQKANKDTFVTFFFSKPVKYHQFILGSPDRLVFDFKDTKLTPAVYANQLQSALVKQVRFANRGKQHVRVVLDLADVATVKKTSSLSNAQLQLHLTTKAEQTFHAQDKTHKGSNVHSKKIPPAIKSPLRDVVVVIDPGHGGKDPGAVGRQGTREKDVVLAIAKSLKQLVDKQPGMRGYLTRKTDHYIGLRERLSLARNYNADIFISIHADAYRNSRSHGVSVFALSQRGASSEAARWLAEKENYSELGGVNLAELDDENGMVRSVLIDLSQTATIGASLKLGERVLDNLDDIARLHHQGVEQARFVVLKSPDIPSILIETGFISNHHEERLLGSRSYQGRLAQSILRGIKHYFSEHPPRHSYLAQQMIPYRVQHGDTLSSIAQKFKLSVAKLKQINKLTSSRIYIGQLLQIHPQLALQSK